MRTPLGRDGEAERDKDLDFVELFDVEVDLYYCFAISEN
jgi:hypothetical protein